MFYTYILWSERLGKFYVGHTGELESRVDYHNRGRVKFTSTGTPWGLVYYEEFQTRGAAVRREAEIKQWKSASAIAQLIESQLR